jgi:RNA polymerase sigma-70 factor (ECF subfamily)
MLHLVERIKQKEPKAYKELYDQYARPMYNLCFRLLNQSDEAEDVLQDSFIKIFDNIHQLQNKDLLSAWIKRICTNTAIQAIRKKQKIKFEELDEQPSMINLQDEEELIHEDEFEQTIANIHHAIKLLPDRYRIVFTMHAIEDYSHEEIAKMLGIVSGTSRSQYLRAKQKLIDIIKKNKFHVRQVEKIYTAI